MSENEVAVFIDLENLRYGLLNTHGQEPDFGALAAKAKKYGRPSVMRAYADFTEHPTEITRSLQIAGIEAINIPVKRTAHVQAGKTVERVKNAADMVLALDAMVEALGADANHQSKLFLLVTGDRDYVKLVTLLRNRFGQRVVVAGVPGSVAADLIAAADEADPIDVPGHVPTDVVTLKRHLVAMVRAGPHPLRYWTVKIIDQWAQDARRGVPGTAKERRDAIGYLLDERIFLRRTIQDPQRGEVTETYLDEARARELGLME